MKKKIETMRIMKGVGADMKFFFPQWFPLVLKMSVLWLVFQFLVFFLFWDSSLEGFLSVVSSGRVWESMLLEGGEVEGFVLPMHSLFLVFVGIGGLFVQSIVGSAWLMYGRGGEEKKSWPLWNRRVLSYIWLWIKFFVTTVVVSILIGSVLSLGVVIVGIVLGFLAFFLGTDLENILLWSGIGVVLMMYIIFGMMTCYVVMRFCLVFAGFARGERVGFFESWRALKGYFVPLMGIGFFVWVVPVFVLLLVVYFLFLGVVALGGMGGVMEVVLVLLSLVLGFIPMMLQMSAAVRIDEALEG